MAPIICSRITALLSCIKNVYQFTCTQQKAPENSEVHRSLQNCGSSVRNLLHVSTMGPIYWRRFLNFWKICGTRYDIKIHSLPHRKCAHLQYENQTLMLPRTVLQVCSGNHTIHKYTVWKNEFRYVVVGGTHNYHTAFKKVSIMATGRLYDLGSIRNKAASFRRKHKLPRNTV